MPQFTSILASGLVAVYMASGVLAGQASYYQPNGGKGACGHPLQNNDLIVALPKGAYDGGKACRKKISVTYKGKTVVGRVEDLCPSCVPDKIDLSEGFFKQFADTSVGILKNVDWKVSN